LKITDVVAIPLRVPQKGDLSGYLPYRESLGRIVRNAWVSCFVKVITDEGVHGTGESLAREVPEATAAIIEKLLKPVLVGRDPRDTEVLWELMYGALRTRGHNRGYFVEALSGVDIALWDLAGKAARRPVYELLGGAFDTRVKTYASSVLYGRPKEMASECLKLVEEGHDQIKVKVGMGEAKDAGNLKAIRDAVGYDVDIMVDANSAYSPYQAIRVGRKFERYECFWFEEPVPPDDIDGYVEVARSLDIPIAGGESHSLRYDFRDLISRNAIDVAMPDAGRAGGISECRKISVLASAFDKKYSPHVGLSGAAIRSASLHLAASMPKNVFLTYEYYHIRGRPNPLSNDVMKKPVETFKDGYVEVPRGPGLGIELDEKVAKKFAITKL
jgi:D-galactarolactone cycloisomerase